MHTVVHMQLHPTCTHTHAQNEFCFLVRIPSTTDVNLEILPVFVTIAFLTG